MSNQTLSITFGDHAENHVGMQKIGKSIADGFTVSDIEDIYLRYKNEFHCELIKLEDALPLDNRSGNEASVLLIRNGVSIFGIDSNDLFNEHISLDVDKKAMMRGRVVNKLARYNLCYGDNYQEPDYEKGKGTIIAFNDVPLLNKIRKEMPDKFGEKTRDLVAELNLYYDITKTGISLHGDTERKIVLCFRLGATIPLHYQWFHRHKPIGEKIQLTLNHGDLYIMSEKATGNDWKKSSKYTLRHAAGCEKYLKVKNK